MTEAIAKKTDWIEVSPRRPPYHPRFAEEYGCTPQQWRVLVDATFPSAESGESIALALSYCKARNLDILKRPVHIVPVWSSRLKRMVETVWPGISELRTTAMRTGAYAGCDPTEFGPEETRTFDRPATDRRQAEMFTVQFPKWAQVTVYRMLNGQRCSFPGPQVYWTETCSTEGKSSCPNDRWRRSPSGQLEKCAEAAALRRAFPEELGGEYAAEEMEGKTVGEEVKIETSRLVEVKAEEFVRKLNVARVVSPKAEPASLEAPSADDPTETLATPSVPEGSGSTEAHSEAELLISDAELEDLKTAAKAQGYDTPRKLRNYTQNRFNRDPEVLLIGQYNELAKEWGF